MKKTEVFRLWSGTGLLLLLGSLVTSAAVADNLPGTFDIEVEGSLVSIRADAAPLGALLDDLADKAGFRMMRFTDPEGAVTIDVVRASLPVALARLLSDHSYQHFETGGTEGRRTSDMLWIMSDGAPVDLAAIEFLESLLVDGDAQESKQAIRQLHQIASTAAIRTLSLALADARESIRRAALAALQQIGNDEALAAIASATADRNAWIRGEAAAALAGDSTASAILYLQQILADADANVRMAAIDSLSELPDEGAVELLSRALQDSDPAVREYAADALEHVGDELAFQAMMSARPD